MPGMTICYMSKVLTICGFLFMVLTGCEKKRENPLASIFDLEGVPVSVDLREHLAGGLSAFQQPEPANTITRQLDLYQDLEIGIQRPESRGQTADQLWDIWQDDPTNFLWIDLATQYSYLLKRPEAYSTMFALPVLADTTRAVGSYLSGRRARTFLERADCMHRTELALTELDSLQQVRLMLNLAYLDRQQSGDLVAAERLIHWLPIARVVGGSRLEAIYWFYIAEYLRGGERLDDALHAAVLAVGMARKLDNDYQALNGRILIADIMKGRREYFGALDLLEECVRVASAKNFPWLINTSLNKAAAFSGLLGDYDLALSYDKRNLAHNLAMGDSLNAPRNMVNVSYDYRMLGQLDSCYVYLKRARTWIDSYSNLVNKARLPLYEAEYFCQIGDYETVDRLLDEARAVLPNAGLPEDEADMLIDQIDMGLEMGHADLAYRAIARLRETRDALRDRLPNQNRLADFEIASADLLARQGEYQLAQEALERARQAVALRGGEGKEWECNRCAGELALLRGDLAAARLAFSQCLTLAKAEGKLSRLEESRFHLGHVLLDLGHYTEARELFRTQVADTSFGGRFRTRLSSLLFLGMSFSREGDYPAAIERFKQALALCNEYSPSDLVTRLHIEQGHALMQQGEVEESERSLLLALALLREAGWRTQVAELRAFNEVAFRDMAETLIGLYIDHPDLLKKSDLAERTLLLAEESRWSAIRTTLATTEKSSEILASLRAVDTPLLAYFVGRGRSFLWLDTGHELQAHNLPGREELLRLLTPVTSDLERPGRPVDQMAARKLSTLLLGPLAGFWPAGQTLRVVPDDILFATPWSALPLPADQGGETEKLVIEHGPVCEAPSLAILASSGTAVNARALRLLAVGQDAAVNESLQQDRLPSLRHAEQEAREVFASWPTGRATVVVGADAVWERLARAELVRHDVIHIASHTVVHQSVPGRSTLRLSSGEESFPVTIGTVSGLELDAELVFLSCCEAARRGSGSGAGLADFARAFMQAGARTVVASAIRVDDEASAFLATRFYHHWLEGKNKAAALRAAQLELRDARTEWSHPYYWAGYRLIGDGT